MKRAISITLAIAVIAAFAFSQVLQPAEVQAAAKLIQEKKYEEAGSILSKFLNSNPQSARGWYLLASARHSKNDFLGAVEALKKNQAIAQNWRGMYNLAAAYARLGDKKAAFEWLEKSLNSGAAFAVNIDADELADQILALIEEHEEVMARINNPGFWSCGSGI